VREHILVGEHLWSRGRGDLRLECPFTKTWLYYLSRVRDDPKKKKSVCAARFRPSIGMSSLTTCFLRVSYYVFSKRTHSKRKHCRLTRECARLRVSIRMCSVTRKCPLPHECGCIYIYIYDIIMYVIIGKQNCIQCDELKNLLGGREIQSNY